VRRETIFELLFAAGVVVAATALAGAALERFGRRALVALAVLVAGMATGAWVSFALQSGREVAVAAGGLTVCAAAVVAGIGVLQAVARGRRIEQQLAEAEGRLRGVVERDTESRAAELERTLARARAESVSLLAVEERRIAEERRSAMAERERRATAELAEALALVERRVEQRLADWASDLDRAQQTLTTQLTQLGHQQREALAEAHARFEADAAELKAAREDQRSMVTRLREDLERAAQETAEATRQELETHEAERRRALHEVSERLRQRERELLDRVASEEAEAVRRIQAGFQVAERRQVEQLERVVDRAASRISEGAVEQFAVAMKGARDDAARRFARELERAIAQFTREAQTVLAERMAQVSDAGAQRLDRRLSEVSAGLERQRDESLETLQRRLADVEGELRSQVHAIAADAEAERAVLEARLHELARRIEKALGTMENRVSA
jgi:hypothetical protein